MNLVIYQRCSYSPGTADLLAAAWAIDRCSREESGTGATIEGWSNTPHELAWTHPKTTLIKNSLAAAKWSICQMAGVYSVRNPEASIDTVQYMCKQVKIEYGINPYGRQPC